MLVVATLTSCKVVAAVIVAGNNSDTLRAANKLDGNGDDYGSDQAD